MELEGGHRNSVIKRRNPIEFGLVLMMPKNIAVSGACTPLPPDRIPHPAPHPTPPTKCTPTTTYFAATRRAKTRPRPELNTWKIHETKGKRLPRHELLGSNPVPPGFKAALLTHRTAAALGYVTLTQKQDEHIRDHSSEHRMLFMKTIHTAKCAR
ncbi:hypothetical protein EVAR_93022_1 [Eumeta japonica]|uniref:Uncharacterized protein n=1 Tax=Eumeta variegata TaxID=151549 RepID=A0A4C2AAL4_EUMVA|nr:hypothetical protein EVAR_93022_1 [Eumeta japonica]